MATTTLRIFLPLILGTIFCECTDKHDYYQVDSGISDQMCPSDQVEFQTTTRSVVSCVRRCSGNPGCKSLIYLRANQTCYGLKSGEWCTGATPMPGAMFYKLATSSGTGGGTSNACSDAMVTGVPDSQLSASSVFVSSWSGITYGAHLARLGNSPGLCWVPASRTIQQYIQVDFVTERTVMSVITQGDGSFPEWVTSYKVLISDDCVIFSAITDGAGNEKVFAGNTDKSSNSANTIDPPVTCRCLRINPVTWNSNIALRFEVIGCLV